jgi:hypothetical protein
MWSATQRQSGRDSEAAANRLETAAAVAAQGCRVKSMIMMVNETKRSVRIIGGRQYVFWSR